VGRCSATSTRRRAGRHGGRGANPHRRPGSPARSWLRARVESHPQEQRAGDVVEARGDVAAGVAVDVVPSRRGSRARSAGSGAAPPLVGVAVPPSPMKAMRTSASWAPSHQRTRRATGPPAARLRRAVREGIRGRRTSQSSRRPGRRVGGDAGSGGSTRRFFGAKIEGSDGARPRRHHGRRQHKLKTSTSRSKRRSW